MSKDILPPNVSEAQTSNAFEAPVALSEQSSAFIFKDGQPINETPTEGVYEIKQSNGRLVLTYKDGKKNGETLIYDGEGKLTNKVTYENDQLNGQVTNYYPTRKAQITTVYKDNVLEGPFISYYPNDVKQSEGNYSKGKLEGPFTFYDEFGDPSKKTTYKDGLEHGLSTCYFPKSQGGGVCQVSRYEKGLLVENQELFYATGELLQKTPYTQGKAQSYPVALDKQGKPITDSANKNRGK